jgi:hypothetical protein
MVSRSGMGGGNVLGTIRHTVSPKLSGEASIKEKIERDCVCGLHV